MEMDDGEFSSAKELLADDRVKIRLHNLVMMVRTHEIANAGKPTFKGIQGARL